MQAARGASLTSDTGAHSNRSRTGLLLGVAVGAWLVDLVTKTLALHKLDPSDPVDAVGSLLRLHLTGNPGAAFSTGTGATPLISLFAIAAFGVVLWLSFRVRDTVWAWAFGLLLAGIAGNLTDRLFREPGPLRGHVIDFLELPHWPIFNVADICINIAAVLIIIQSLRGIPLGGAKGDKAVDAAVDQEEKP